MSGKPGEDTREDSGQAPAHSGARQRGFGPWGRTAGRRAREAPQRGRVRAVGGQGRGWEGFPEVGPTPPAQSAAGGTAGDVSSAGRPSQPPAEASPDPRRGFPRPGRPECPARLSGAVSRAEPRGVLGMRGLPGACPVLRAGGSLARGRGRARAVAGSRASAGRRARAARADAARPRGRKPAAAAAAATATAVAAAAAAGLGPLCARGVRRGRERRPSVRGAASQRSALASRRTARSE